MNRFFLLTLLSGAVFVTVHAQEEVCADHPAVPRFTGADLVHCAVVNEMAYRVPVGPETGYRRISDWVSASGTAQRYFYTVSAAHSLKAVYKHYQQLLAGAGFEELAGKFHDQRNVSKLVGGNTWLITFYRANRFPGDPPVRINEGSMSEGATFYLAGSLEKPSGKVHLAVAGKQSTDAQHVILVDVIQEGALAWSAAPAPDTQLQARGGAANFMGSSAAGSLEEQLMARGKAAVYGIQYNFNKYVIKDESAPLLDEIGHLLRDNPSVKLFVVGHTAMDSRWEEMLDLGYQRAESVIAYLKEYHEISEERLVAFGAGPMAPVASNAEAAGREKNERIELVLWEY